MLHTLYIRFTVTTVTSSLYIGQINQAKPECGRQTLVELLIRPVQRLPSVALLLNGSALTHTHLEGM